MGCDKDGQAPGGESCEAVLANVERLTKTRLPKDEFIADCEKDLPVEGRKCLANANSAEELKACEKVAIEAGKKAYKENDSE